jgi:Kelch motif
VVVAKCIEWAWQTVTECVSWAQRTVQKCVSWGTKTSEECCDWWPCSWACDVVVVIVSFVCIVFTAVTTLVCAVFAVVTILACVAFGLIVSAVCVLAMIVVVVFCLVWSIVEAIFCLSSANGGTAFLLTDGTVMMQECKSAFLGVTRRWWKLTPDAFGSYTHGSWSRLADSGLGRLYFASSVLADGRVLVCGGEYSDATGNVVQNWSNSCEIYDPVANEWSPVATPTDQHGVTWDKIGDATSTLLPDGKFLMGSVEGRNLERLDPATLTWTALRQRPEVPNSDEDSWVLMPDNTVAAPSCSKSPTTWVYDITADQWNRGNPLPVRIVDAGHEIGPALLRYDGTAFFFGSNQHTAVYSPRAKEQWYNGPDLPAQNGRDIGIVDGPAALMVNGNILFGAGPINDQGGYLSPCFYFEFDGLAFNRTSDPPNHDCPTYVTRLLLLPDGTTLFCREDDSSFYAYQSDHAELGDSTRPVIQTCPMTIAIASTIQVSGLQFNGLSQAVAYGDDSQTPTNYPLARVTNKQSKHVRYCRTFNHTMVNAQGNTLASMGVATGATVITTSVEIPADLEPGDSSLVVVANGIPSVPFDVTVFTVQEQSGDESG